jgi:hypothetical protein
MGIQPPSSWRVVLSNVKELSKIITCAKLGTVKLVSWHWFGGGTDLNLENTTGIRHKIISHLSAKLTNQYNNQTVGQHGVETPLNFRCLRNKSALENNLRYYFVGSLLKAVNYF